MTDAPVNVRRDAGRIGAPGVALHVAVLLFGLAGLFGKWIASAGDRHRLWPNRRGRRWRWRGAAPPGPPARQRRVFEWRIRGQRRGAGAALVRVFQGDPDRRLSRSVCSASRAFRCSYLILEIALLRTRRARLEWAIAGLVVGWIAVLVPEPKPRQSHRARPGVGRARRVSVRALAVSNRVLAVRRSAQGDRLLAECHARPSCLSPTLALAPSPSDARDVALLLVLGVVCTALAHTLFIRSMRVLSAHTASVVVALEPVYGIALAVVLLARGARRAYVGRRCSYRRRRAGGALRGLHGRQQR